jgi:hypothetical protein
LERASCVPWSINDLADIRGPSNLLFLPFVTKFVPAPLWKNFL